MVKTQEFRKSTAGLVLALLALGIGVVGLIVSLSIGEFSSAVGFIGIISLGAFLTYMQRRAGK